MKSYLRRWGAIGVLLSVVVVVSAPNQVFAQDSEGRKIVSKVAPRYPELARRMQIHGAVRLDVVVEPNGTVKTIQVKGGHPILAQAAQEAVEKWRWEPAPHETTQPVEVKFEDQ